MCREHPLWLQPADIHSSCFSPRRDFHSSTHFENILHDSTDIFNHSIYTHQHTSGTSLTTVPISLTMDKAAQPPPPNPGPVTADLAHHATTNTGQGSSGQDDVPADEELDKSSYLNEGVLLDEDENQDEDEQEPVAGSTGISSTETNEIADPGPVTEAERDELITLYKLYGGLWKKMAKNENGTGMREGWKDPRLKWRRLVILAHAYNDGRVSLTSETKRSIDGGREAMQQGKKPYLLRGDVSWPEKIEEAPKLLPGDKQLIDRPGGGTKKVAVFRVPV